MPSTADKPLYDLVRRNEEPLLAAFAIPKLDLILNLPEGSPKHGSQFIPQRLPISISGASNIKMPQDCCPVPARRHMAVLEITRFRRGDPQLRSKVTQDIGLDIARPRRKSRPRSEEAQLKRKPDPARTIDPLNQSDVIKR